MRVLFGNELRKIEEEKYVLPSWWSYVVSTLISHGNKPIDIGAGSCCRCLWKSANTTVHPHVFSLNLVNL